MHMRSCTHTYMYMCPPPHTYTCVAHTQPSYAWLGRERTRRTRLSCAGAACSRALHALGCVVLTLLPGMVSLPRPQARSPPLMHTRKEPAPLRLLPPLASTESGDVSNAEFWALDSDRRVGPGRRKA